MAGWSKAVVDDDGDGSGLEKSVRNLHRAGPLLHLEPGSEQQQQQQNHHKKEVNGKKIKKGIFVEFLTSFYKQVYGNFCIRPLPPMLGDGQSVDLLKLFLVVREKGGYEEVSKNESWGLVGKECGFDSHAISDLKLVYVKYLDLLDKWLQKIVKGKDSGIELAGEVSNSGEVSMDLELGFEGILNEILDKKRKDGKCLNMELKSDLKCLRDGEFCIDEQHRFVLESDGAIKNVDDKSFVENGNEGGFQNVEVNISVDINDVRTIGNVSEERIGKNGKNDDMASGSSVGGEDELSRKRKRECYSGMIKWITELAKDPCDPAVGSLPERYRWKHYGNEHSWKQVLLVRETMLLRKNADSGIQQNKQMHPAMYEDGSERLRCSQRLLSAKESVNKARRKTFPDSSSSATDDNLDDKMSDSTADSTDYFWVNTYRQKRVPLGPNFQADVPEWNGEIQESDTKWVGTRMWPMKEQGKNLIERERIGKGRQESCGCPSPGSVDCVRFHSGEKRTRVKLELGPAFYLLKFNSMGEEVALSWIKEEEKKFQHIVESNPLSLGKCFWDELLKCFPSKGRESLVRYYFNVFLLRRRGHQNRMNPSNIDSDDDEAELGSAVVKAPPGSIFCSPKKVHLNSR